MPKTLADGRAKLVLLTTEPADPNAPTVTELEAGIPADERILKSDFLWGATDSEKINEPALSQDNNANAIGMSNYQAGLTAFRYFDETGAVDATGDEVYQALRVKGTRIWGYLRENGKKASEPFAADDEVYGILVETDEPQRPSETGGYIKRRIPLEPQEAWPAAKVATAGV